MDGERINILLIEDSPADARLLRELVARAEGAEFDVECADRLSKGLERLAQGGIDVALVDLSLPDSWGLDTFARAHAQAPDVPIVVLTGFDDKVIAIRAMQEGAQDYLVKGEVDSRALERAIRGALQRRRDGQ